MKPEKINLLDHGNYIRKISRAPEFLAELPRENIDTLAPGELQRKRRLAVALGAAALAETFRRERTDADAEANVMSLIAHLDRFYQGQTGVNKYREKYPEGYDTRKIPPKERKQFFADRQEVTEFNHVLHEVINSVGGQHTFNELLTFMTNQHILMGGGLKEEKFKIMANSALVGMRNEVAVEQVLIQNDMEYTLGNVKEDAKGADFIIDNTTIDVKASEPTAKKAKLKAIERGRNPDLIVWSHINYEDFEGQLVLPERHNMMVGAELLPDIQKAIHSSQHRSRRQA